MRQLATTTGIGLLLLFGATVLSGCAPAMHTRMAWWPNGQPRARESYYLDSSGQRVMHGPTSYWDDNGKLVRTGTWRHGKPWDGVCWVPALGDAGSVGGLGTFKRYKEGKFVEDVEGRP